MKIGMLTSGGDCQGLNSALRGVAKTLYNELGSKVTIYGIRDGYRGLIEGDYHEMNSRDFSVENLHPRSFKITLTRSRGTTEP